MGWNYKSYLHNNLMTLAESLKDAVKSSLFKLLIIDYCFYYEPEILKKIKSTRKKRKVEKNEESYK